MSMFSRRPRGLVFYQALLFVLLAGSAFGQFVPGGYILLLQDPPVSARFQNRAEMQSAAGVQYRTQIEARQQTVLAALATRNIRVTGRVSTLLNAIFVSAPASRIPDLLSIPGVAAVRPMRRYQALLDKAVPLMNGPAAWTALGGQGNAGLGMKIAIIDTGIDQTHPAFQDATLQPPSGFPKCSGFTGNCSDFTNSKVIVARSYVQQLATANVTDPKNPAAQSQPDDYTPRDHVGHGTATASAAAANQNTGIATFTGMAPKAYIGNYKIFGSPNLNDSPTDAVMIQAVEDALNDGMNVASLSVGGPALTGPLDTGAACGIAAGQPCDPLAAAYENAAKAGMVVVAAAGNSGSDAIASGGNYPSFNSISSPSTAPSVISVGATTNSHGLTPTVSVNDANAAANLKGINAAVTDAIFYPSAQGANSAPLIDVSQLGNDGTACTALPGGSLNGAYALVMRGNGTNCTLASKASNVQQAGAIGAVFYMSDSTPAGIATGLSFQGPAVSISNADGVALKSYIDANPGKTVTIDVAGKETDLTSLSTIEGISIPITQNELASYSSVGPAPDGSVKPDLVATGGLDPNVSFSPGMYLAAQNYDLDGILYSTNRYATADGTSFATPLVAGAAALVKQAHPNYTATQVKSALVNAAAQDTKTDDGHVDANGTQQPPQPVNVQWIGGGRLDAGAGVGSSITVEPATVSFGFLKSVTLPISKALKVTNQGASAATITVAVAPNNQPAGVTVATDNTTLTLNPGQAATLNVTLSGTVPAAGSYSGVITLSAGNAVQRVPYLFIVPSGTAFNAVALNGDFQGIPGADSGTVIIQVTDQFGAAVAGAPVALSVSSPKNGVTFQSVTGEPACTPNNSSTATCNTDNYGFAYAEVILGAAAGAPSITATLTGTPFQFSFNAFILPAPAITAGQVLDNAAFQPVVAPGSIAAIKGANLMEQDLLVNTAQGYDLIPPVFTYFPLSLDAVSVSFDVPSAGISVPAPVVAVSPGQINVQVPWELRGQTSAQVKVIVDEVYGPAIYSAPVTVQVSDYTPAFFTNSGNVADALDTTYHVITSSNPAIRGQVIALYANGLGPVSNPPANGVGAGASSLTTTPCSVSIGGQVVPPGQVLFCGLAPGLAIYQVNVQVPTNISAGNQPVTVTIGGKTSPSGIVIPVQ